MPFPNAVVSLNTRTSIHPTHISHPQMIDNCDHAFHQRDDRNILSQLILRILSYCYDNIWYTATHTLANLILQIQTSLDRAGDFSLVTKLSRTHKNVTSLSSTRTPTIHHPHSLAQLGAKIMKSHILAKWKYISNPFTSMTLRTT